MDVPAELIPMPRRILLAAVLLAFASMSGRAQQQPPQPAPQQPPATRPGEQPQVTFKVEINYVEVDASVTDASGNFVRGLTKDDFQILEQGKPQTVAICSLVDIPVERPDAPLFSPTAIEPDTRANWPEFNGRLFVLVLDDLNTDFSHSLRVRAAARQFIERYLGANDLAAIVTTGGGRAGAQEFTSSRPRLLRALDGFSGQKLRSATLEKIDDYYRQRDLGSNQTPKDAMEAERAHKARNSMSTLKSVSDYLGGIRGRRKAVIFFSEGLDYDITNPIENTYASTVLDDLQQATAAATRANVSFYAIDPRGLGGLGEDMMTLGSVPIESPDLGTPSLMRELQNAQDTLRIVANETGGFAAVNQNDFRDAFSRIVRENSSYYILGYYSNDERRDGRFRKVDVQTKRPGLSVRALKGYVAPKGKPSRDDTVSNQKVSAPLREALNSPIPVSALGLSAFAAPMRAAGSNASIVMTLEIQGAALKFAQQKDVFADDVEIAVVAMDATGKIKDGGHDVMQLRLQPQTHALVAASGVRISRRLELPPGRYQLRLGARDGGSGAVGSIVYDLDVPDFSKSPLSMSGLLLTSAFGSRVPTANPDPELKQVMPGPPVSLRTFPHNDTLSLFAEVYDAQPTPPHRVAIKTSVIADNGSVVFNAADERRSEELQGKKGGYGYTATIPLKDFAQGRYVLRVEAQSLVDNAATTKRELEFSVR
jgi:VWFA-related protein